MIDLTKYNKIYFIGIGGISMSGIAVILKRWDFTILGSDRNESPQTDWLKKQGIEVYIGHNADNIKSDIELVVFTAAIKNDNPELIKAKELGIPCIERGKFLGELTKLYKDTIGVAGTHGKTSTTSMLALSFVAANYDPSVQVGAFLKNLKGNYRIGSSDYFIVEACEYNDSYLNFKQRSAIVLNVDDDHLDYFKNLDNIQKSFEKYISLLPEDGFLVLNRDDERCFELRNHTKAKVISVGSDNRADWYYKNVTYDHDGYPSFELYHYNEYIDKVSLKVLGKHNVFNSLCCIAMCDAYGISIKTVKFALLNYTGAVRRLQYKGLFKGAKVYDDYGHHPTEIKATINAIKQIKYNKSWVVFEAHTYSRLKDHLLEFVEALTHVDNIIVMDIYAAREINTFNIKEDDVVNELKKRNKNAIHISDYNKIVEYLRDNVHGNDLILTLGAGNVTKISDLLIDKTTSSN